MGRWTGSPPRKAGVFLARDGDKYAVVELIDRHGEIWYTRGSAMIPVAPRLSPRHKKRQPMLPYSEWLDTTVDLVGSRFDSTGLLGYCGQCDFPIYKDELHEDDEPEMEIGAWAEQDY